MGTIGFLFLAVALAMDSFSVSLSCGMIQKYMGRQVWIMSFFFGFFQALMPFIGWQTANVFREEINAYDHWIAFVLLAFIGGRMCLSTKKSSDETHRFNPSSLKVLLTLAIATSIDALAVGFSFIGMGIHTISDIVIPLIIIGLVSFVLSFLGKFIGVRISSYCKIPAELIGGCILIAIGFKVLVEHLTA